MAKNPLEALRRLCLSPYVGHRGWLGVYLDVPVDWKQIAELVTDAYREVAPKRLRTELESRETMAPSRRAKKGLVARKSRGRRPDRGRQRDAPRLRGG